MTPSLCWGDTVRGLLSAQGAQYFGDVLDAVRRVITSTPYESASILAAVCSSHLLELHDLLPQNEQDPAVIRVHLVQEDLWRVLENPRDVPAQKRLAEALVALEDDPDVDIDAVAAVYYAASCSCRRNSEEAYWAVSRVVDAAFARAAHPPKTRPSYSFQRHDLSPAQLALLGPNEIGVDITFATFAAEAADSEVQDALRRLQNALQVLAHGSHISSRLRAVFSVTRSG